jgi:hypothetical protein
MIKSRHITEGEAKEIVLVRAMEESLGESSLDTVESASSGTSDSEAGEPETWLLARARNLSRTLESRYSVSTKKILEQEKRAWVVFFLSLAVFAFLSGVVSNYLSSDGRVNLILNPLVFLFAWNLTLYVFQILAPLLIKNAPSGGIILKTLQRCWQFVLRKTIGVITKNPREKAISKGLWEYQRYCLANCSRTIFLKLRLALGFAGLALAGGVVTGLYLRGLFVDYSFYVESTFFNALEFLAGAVKFIYFPVALVFRQEIPPVYGNNGEAWILFLVLSALFYIGIPRFVLSLVNWFSLAVARNRVGLDLGDPYFRDLLAPVFNHEREAALILFDCHLREGEEGELLAELSTVFGESFAPIDRQQYKWGDLAEGTAVETGTIVFIFNGLQTPEEEVHGEFIKSFQDGWDGAFFAAVRYRGLKNDELARRQKQWDSLLQNAGIEQVVQIHSGENHGE